MAALIIIALVVVVIVAAIIGGAVWYWTCRRPFVGALADELHAKAQMDALTQRTAQAMRTAARQQPEHVIQLWPDGHGNWGL